MKCASSDVCTKDQVEGLVYSLETVSLPFEKKKEHLEVSTWLNLIRSLEAHLISSLKAHLIGSLEAYLIGSLNAHLIGSKDN